MKSIYNVYESIADDEQKIINDTLRHTVTREIVKSTMEKCIPSLAHDANTDITINPDNGTLKVIRFSYYVHRDGLHLIEDLPDIIKFSEFDADRDTVVTAFGDKVTTLRGLPDDLSEFELKILDCPNLKDFGDVKKCKTLFIKSIKEPKIDFSKIKRLPKAEKFIRIVGCGDVDVKYISKISGTPKNKISVL